ncbi:MAG TPA: carboxypeptidase regulatory-like domain-containing protein [Verrucomicrobiae bacterium]|nr:carboxypeptidase regulatory-like domain-containing protein [Verrucomicrobiae bacterium]
MLRRSLTLLLMVSALLLLPAVGQNASTGAVSGIVTDQSGAVVSNAQITVTNVATGDKRTTASSSNGSFSFPLLPPGKYRARVTATGFRTWETNDVTVGVTETSAINPKLAVGAVNEVVTVTGAESQVQTESAQLGSVTDSREIESLPLVSRDYLQIIGLNPGVSTEITNAGDLGRGNASLASAGDGFSAGGSTTNDNNFQMNGVEVNDNFGAGLFTGGLPVPNPDTLQEFKVLTGQYDAANGRNGGAVVDVLTKTGSNAIHGSVFEFFRNDALNANEWFNKMNAQPRQVLKQNQFGFTLGGPIIKDKLLYFGSYQGTRQRNGVSSGCAVTTMLPPLTNDRSAAGLGAVFGGQRGEIQNLLGGVGPAIASDGSNINPVALTLMQMKGPDGGFLIPTPQTITAGPYSDTQGSASFSVPCPFTEDQFMTNVDYSMNSKSRLQGRFFFANSTATQTIPAPNSAGTGVPGFPYGIVGNFRNASITHTYTFRSNLLNQLVFGFNHSLGEKVQGELFSWSDIGATVPSFANAMPGIGISQVGLGGYGQTAPFGQDTYVLEDSLAWTRGHHNLRFGGGFTKAQTNEANFQYFGAGIYLTFADFLLGLDANDNGTAAVGVPYSNEYLDLALPGLLGRHYRYWDGNAYVQDDIKLTPRFTLNVGLRFEHLGDFSEAQGRNTGLNLNLVNPNPPATGTLAGYIVPSNYPGTPPTGVAQGSNKFGIQGVGQNSLEPRLGFAWQLPETNRVVLRGGYGYFRSRFDGNGLIQSLTAQPWASVVLNIGSPNAAASLQNPIPQTIPSFPSWTPYTSTSSQTFQGPSQNYQPSVWQRYSMDVQSEVAKDFIFDVGFVGGRGTKLFENVYANQADLASATNPIRGQTTNTITNIPLRVPYEGWNPAGLLLNEPGGEASYNALQASLNKHFSHGLNFLIAYTYARDLTDTQGGVVGGGFGGSIFGNQFTARQTSYGPEAFIRPQRLVVSYSYQLPHPANLSSLTGEVLGGWGVSGVTTLQNGHQLTAILSNPNNAYGIPYDRPDYTPGCKTASSGSIQNKIHNNSSYFNAACFTAPPVLDPTVDPLASAFGNAPIGNVAGPGEVDFDFAVVKNFKLRLPKEGSNIEFRSEFFNLFNHPIFNDPNTGCTLGLAGPSQPPCTGAGFGEITGPTIVAPRVIQFALKWMF